MSYSTTITKKGQITIPKSLRDFLRLKESARVVLELEKNKRVVKIKPASDFLEIAKKIKIKKKINPIQSRKYMEKFYEPR